MEKQKFISKKTSFLLTLTLILMLISIRHSFAEVKNIDAVIVEVQKYGNVVLDIKTADLLESGYEVGDTVQVQLKNEKLIMPYGTSYSDVDNGELIFRNDKERDFVIIAINMGNFSQTYDAKINDKLVISLDEKASYLNEYILRQLKRTNDREDYKTDSIYANFRAITTTGINAGVLYRSSSPVNNELNRAKYADELSEAVGIKTVLNLADNKNEIDNYIKSEDFESNYYKQLYDSNNVKLLDMTVDINSEDFSKKLADGLTYLSKKPAPYLIHCTEGKDRAGFVSAVLEALMGADIDEIVNDYMLTYENYYNVKKSTEQYDKIAQSNIELSIKNTVLKLAKEEDISKVDISKRTNDYLLEIGMKQKDIDNLKKNLSSKAVFKTPNIKGIVTQIEKYGHVDTNILIDDLNKTGIELSDMLTVVFDKGFVIHAPYLDGYLVDTGKPLVRAYPNHKTVAIAINYDKLAEIADVQEGDKLTIMLSKKEGYKLDYEVRKLERTYEREDYKTDEIYANFRNVKIGNIKENILFRSSSPVNNELNRAYFADKLMQDAKIATVVNLADNEENVQKYLESSKFFSPYYKKLYENNKVILLNLGLAYKSDEFKKGIVKGLEFMADNEPPYLFHCTEGKDRTGYMSVIIAALMGATEQEIVDDYMQSYFNFYKIDNKGDKYEYIKKDVINMMQAIAGTKELTKENLSTGAEKLLIDSKMDEEKIQLLKEKLSK